MNLSERKNTVIIHYGCADFNKPVHTIFWIGAIYYDNQVKNYFFENGNERDIIERFRNFLDDHQEKTLYSFRHSGAIEIFKRTGSITKLQKAMGHSNLMVSMTYLRGLEISELEEGDMPMV